MLNKGQKEQIRKALLQLHFKYRETLVFMAILQETEATILSIAEETGLSRGTVFDIVEKLKKRGFVAEIKKGKRRRLIADKPIQRFYSQLEDKHDEIEKERKIIDEILPIIKTLSTEGEHKPEIRIYSGEDGFRRVWNEILNAESKGYLSLARHETFAKFIGENGFQEIQEKKRKLNIASREITEDSNQARQAQEFDRKYNRQTRLVGQNIKFPMSEIIFDNKIAMFSTTQENMILVIESKDFAETHRAYFEMFWMGLAT